MFRFSIPLDVRFGDIDAFGHVNHAVFFTYMEQSRSEYVVRLGLPALMPSDLNFILAEAACSYKAPIFYGTPLEVKTRVERIGTSSFKMAHQIENRSTRQILAVGHSILVIYDYHQNKSVSMPDDWRAAIEKFEAGQ
jgi:acyl-CoA thioester hydrolase